MHDSPQANGLSAAQQRAIDTLYRAFNEHDPGLLDAVLTDDWQDAPLGPGQQPGREGFKPVVAMFGAVFPDVNITILDMLGCGDRVAVRAQITGTHSGELFGVAATGKPVLVAIHEFHRFEGERIAQTWHLEDWFGMLNQLGAWPLQ